MKRKLNRTDVVSTKQRRDNGRGAPYYMIKPALKLSTGVAICALE